MSTSIIIFWALFAAYSFSFHLGVFGSYFAFLKANARSATWVTPAAPMISATLVVGWLVKDSFIAKSRQPPETMCKNIGGTPVSFFLK